MKPVLTITLENEMDLVLIQKRCTRLCELLFLTLSGRATFITAATEICREVIEETNLGSISFYLRHNNSKYTLSAVVSFPLEFTDVSRQSGIQYAKKLVTHFEEYKEQGNNVIELRLSLPRSSRLDDERIKFLTRLFEDEEPLNAYDEIKRKNFQQGEELKGWRFLNEQKSEFLSIASHELKTPLTTLKAYTQLALSLDDSECSDNVRKFLRKIEIQTGKINNLIQQLLDVSKIESGVLNLSHETVAFKEFIEDIVSVHRHLLPTHHLTLTMYENCELVIDKLRIEQVISNIIMNAAKYSSRDSNIHITVHSDEKEMQVEIRDEGIGMSVKAQEHAFQKFYREESIAQHYSGLGMGLYIASRIIAEHNGRIWIHSEPGKGSSFYFSLPQTVAVV